MEEKAQGSQKNTGMAVLAYIIFFIPLLTDAKNDPFVKYHVKQGLVLFIGWIVEMFVGVIPFAGWIIAPLLGVFLLVLFIIGIVNAVNGKEKPLPVVGSFAENFKF
jgi:uncharacterized membrane protein